MYVLFLFDTRTCCVPGTWFCVVIWVGPDYLVARRPPTSCVSERLQVRIMETHLQEVVYVLPHHPRRVFFLVGASRGTAGHRHQRTGQVIFPFPNNILYAGDAAPWHGPQSRTHSGGVVWRGTEMVDC